MSKILFTMPELLFGTPGMFFQVVIVMLCVLMAMIIDLGSGLYKAKQRNEVHRSEALKRTLTKFITYEGGLFIASLVDVLIHYARFWELTGITLLLGVPIITIIVGIFLLIVEFLSVREKADAKTKKSQDQTLALLLKLMDREEIKEMLRMYNQKKHIDDEVNLD